MAKLFSVITVTKDNLDGLTHTVKSTALQTHTDYEHIIIDGASTDGTSAYINSVILSESEGYQKIIFMSEPDDGLYDAMNKGLAKATGDYVIFMNAGDVFADADILELIAEQMETHPDFLYGDALETDSSGNLFYKKAHPYTKAARGMFTHHQSMIYKRELIADLRYDTAYKLAADYDFTLRALNNVQRVTYCPFPICIFESGGLSQTHANTARTEERDIKIKLGKASQAVAHVTAARQALSFKLKSCAPSLYWRLKSLTIR